MPLATSEFQDLVRRAEGGEPDAQCRLAELHHYGDGIPRNYLEAEKWYLLSDEQNHLNARFGLGRLYVTGLDKKDLGIALLESAGMQGHGLACLELGRALCPTGMILSSDEEKAIAAYAWFCLAEAYGFGCEKYIQKLDTQLSIEWVLSAQARAQETFRPPVVLTSEEKLNRVNLSL